MAIEMKPVVIAAKYYDNKALAVQLGLMTVKQSLSHVQVLKLLADYNESIADQNSAITIYKSENPSSEKEQIADAIERNLIETRQDFSHKNGDIIIYNVKNNEKAEIELARQALIDRLPIEVLIPIPIVETTALDEAAALLQAVNPSLAAQLKAQFKAMQQEATKKAPSTKKPKIPKSEKILAAILKMKTVFEAYQVYILAGKKPSQAKMNVAVDRESSSGAVHLCCIGYKLYRDYPAITQAVDSGNYLTTALALDGVNTERSSIISEKLGVDLIISIDY